MYLDMFNCFTGVLATGATAQNITASAVSTNVIDLGPGDVGKAQGGSPMLLVRCKTAFNNLTSLAIKLQTATDAAFTTPVDLPINQTILLAALTTNTELIRQALPIGCLQFIRLNFTVAGTAPTQGSIEAYLAKNLQTA